MDAKLHFIDQSAKSRGSGWSQAVVTKVDKDKLTIDYKMESVVKGRTVDRWLNELAPFESQTQKIWQYKSNLKVEASVLKIP